jgi:hypothetical protein
MKYVRLFQGEGEITELTVAFCSHNPRPTLIQHVPSGVAQEWRLLYHLNPLAEVIDGLLAPLVGQIGVLSGLAVNLCVTTSCGDFVTVVSG